MKLILITRSPESPESPHALGSSDSFASIVKASMSIILHTAVFGQLTLPALHIDLIKASLLELQKE